jgi:leucyl aminopeptidase (aminopeptidase T)
VDLVIEYAVAYLVHSQMWRKAREAGVPMKCLTGMNADMMIRCINPDLDAKMNEFGAAYREVVSRGKVGGRVTNAAGTDITYKVGPPRPILPPLPGPHARGVAC